MIYERFKDRLLTLLKAPKQPPDPPAGSRGSVQIFRAAPNFLKYQMVVWGAGFVAGIVGEIALVLSGHAQAEGTAEKVVGYVLLGLTVAAAVVKYFLIRIDYDMRMTKLLSC